MIHEKNEIKLIMPYFVTFEEFGLRISHRFKWPL